MPPSLLGANGGHGISKLNRYLIRDITKLVLKPKQILVGGCNTEFVFVYVAGADLQVTANSCPLPITVISEGNIPNLAYNILPA